MKPKTLKPNDVDTLIATLKKGEDDSIGSYIVKGYRIQISKHNLTGAQRVQMLYKKRRDNGLCIICGTKVTKKNPRSGKLYRLCETHRGLIDKRK
ncbi:profilin domain protein [Leptospira sp. GIMC2001]|uniref:profilin domain protein n=1 Tax=Leptospira sp. GIMC2001 TaxID=1513297 RepID=UPI00234BB1ED|nr:profilin domain protein [Leptospira sp. GIMC2001]WCL48952.1 profilin domain protein [Leptospira sp. GIMC2001]